MQNNHNLQVYYKKEWIDTVFVTANFQQAELSAVMQTLLRKTTLTYILYNPVTVVIVPADSTDKQQESPEKPNQNKLALGANKRVVVKGIIKDARTDEPISGASIFSEASKAGTISDKNGFYVITLQAGQTNLVVTYLGYEKEKKELNLVQNTTLDIGLFKTSAQLAEVQVTAGRKADSNVSGVQTGVNKLEMVALKKLPTFLGEADVINNIKLLPGVTSVGEAATGFNVRGGNIDQNLILLDDAPIYNSSHLFGFFSVFNPNAIKDATLYRGGIPAQFGSRVSSVLDVTQKEGNLQKISGNGGIGLITGRLSVEGPIVKEKTSFIVAGRSSYSNWLMHRLPNASLRESQASFYDLSGKISHAINAQNKITLSAYQSSDNFGFAVDTLYKWTSRTASLKYTHFFTNNFLVDVGVNYSNYKFSLLNKEENSALDYSNGIASKNVKANFIYSFPRQEFNFGASIINYGFQPGQVEPISEFSQITSTQIQREQSLESSIYFNHEYEFTPRLTVIYGLRYSMFNNYGNTAVFVYEPGVPKKLRTITDTLSYTGLNVIKTYHGPEPRISIKYSLSDLSSVKFGFNRMRQYIHLISNTAAASPIDIWKTSNTYIKPQIGDQVSLGYFRNFSQNKYEASIEGYYKQISNILDYKNGATLFLNEAIEADLLPGIGKAYGVEMILNKNAGRLTGLVSYAYSRTLLKINGPTEEEKINRGEWYRANYDKPHVFNMVSSYKVKKRVTFSTNFTYSTGRPVSIPLSYYIVGPFKVPNFGDRNNYRLPAYHRLDLAVSVLTNHKKDKKWEGSWNVSVYNVYGRKNPYSVFFKHIPGAPPQTYQLAVVGVPLPSVSYEFKF
ncbi:TonB-dependent receptor [Adhaeribacter aquaticus]|uniref:TonB-dependent receptor n=1 Tax=Adhaeribacter aquaticus TaxID=299567 RepID=UPI00146FC247|nr:carboxypeptidase-like regulatory domain-containing protein [Adhaeribacter aquaticus]